MEENDGKQFNLCRKSYFKNEKLNARFFAHLHMESSNIYEVKMIKRRA